MNKEKIIDVLRKEEALIIGTLQHARIRRCGHPGRCAIGALLWAAGATAREIRSCNSVYCETKSEENDSGMQLYNTISVNTFNNRSMHSKWKQAKVTFYCFKAIHVKIDVN